ncbi:hypothetical protein KM043_015242 [Ampulex compressa]|nr:hypothetical protein KM043_015242 [Ampulex compressa]
MSCTDATKTSGFEGLAGSFERVKVRTIALARFSTMNARFRAWSLSLSESTGQGKPAKRSGEGPRRRSEDCTGQGEVVGRRGRERILRLRSRERSTWKDDGRERGGIGEFPGQGDAVKRHGLWDGLGTSGTRVGMEWTRDKTLELLREYQQRRVLWDWNARGYRDRAKRKRAIQELAEILCCNTLEVEKKITNLKCQYSREVHKIQNSRDAATGPDDVYVSKWFAFKAMQFLQFGTRRYSKRKKKVEEESKLQEEYIVSDIDPESITFIDCNEETNGSGTGSFNASLSEDAEESSSSSLKAMELYNGSLQEQSSPLVDLDESGRTKLETSTSNDRKKTKEEFAKFGESIAVQLAEIPDSYSRSVAKLRINQILFEAEIGVYAQTRR